MFKGQTWILNLIKKNLKIFNLILLFHSEIYCHGKLLETVQMARIFNDSKYFVDMKMKMSPDEILEDFNAFMDKYHQNPSREDIASWVNTNFDPPGGEFEKWIPADHHKDLKILDRISDKQLRQWAIDLNDIWLELGRKMKKDVVVSIFDPFGILLATN